MKLKQKEKIKRLEAWYRIHSAILFHVWRLERNNNLTKKNLKLFLSFLKKKAEKYGVDTTENNITKWLDANRIIFGSSK